MSLNNIFSPALIDFIADSVIKGKNENHWDRFIANAEPFETKFIKKLKSFWNEQRDEVIDNLQLYKSKDITDVTFDFESWRIRFEEFEQLLLPGIIESWGQEELNTLLVGVSFNALLPEVTEFINTYAYRFSFDVNTETQKQLRDLFTESINIGDGVPQIEKKIRQLFTDMNKYRSVRIARTEVIRAQNFGAEESYVQSGVVAQKEWWTARDERRCFFCASLHGKRIDLRQNYHNQGDILEVEQHGEIQRLRLNYEDIKRPPLHVSCRCTLIPIMTE